MNHYTADKFFMKRQLVRTRRAHLELFVRLMVVFSLLGVLFWPSPKKNRVLMPPPEVLPQSNDPCAAAVGVGKVALMFLTRGELYHEATWRLWLRSAGGVLPTEAAASPAVCGMNATSLARARLACGVDSDPGGGKRAAGSAIDPEDIIAAQHLFSIYIHLSVEVDEAALSPIWRRHLVPKRVQTEWGTHSLVEATRSMLWEAFRDPANQRFILASEADIPIWDPLTFYREAMAEQRSRVDAWWHPDMDVKRWSLRMALSGARIRRTDWRKSAQWFTLIRSHAEVTLRDQTVFLAFADYCQSAWDGDLGRFRECYSDEHYLPTLLHMKGLQEETVPSPLGVTAADWSEHQPHPHEYTAGEISAELVTTRLRNNSDCPGVGAEHAAVQKEARRSFVVAAGVLGAQQQAAACKAGAGKKGLGLGPPLLASGCSLLARKFPRDTMEAVGAVFSNCSNGLMLVGDACNADGAPSGWKPAAGLL